MKHSLLYISYYFPPIKSIAVKRNYYFSLGLQHYFEDVRILTTTNYKVLEQEGMQLDGLTVRPLTTFDYRTVLAKFRKNKNTHFSEIYKKNWLVSTLIKLNETFPFNLFMGEGGLVYIWNGYNEGKSYISSQKVHHIITSYRPFANVFIGYLLKIKYKELVWIVNFHDFPIDEIRRNVYFQPLQEWVWKKMLKQSNHCITVSKGVENNIRKLSPNVTTIMNGVMIRKSANRHNKKFRIVYTGSLYHNLSKPELLFKVLRELLHSGHFLKEDIEIVYAGKDANLWNLLIREFELENVSTNLGNLTSQEAMAVQDSAQINVLLTWASVYQSGVITGKFYEYLGSTNLILAIINGVLDNEIKQLFDELKCGKVVATDDANSESKMRDFLLTQFNAWKNNTLPESYISHLTSFSWEKQIEKVADLMFQH